MCKIYQILSLLMFLFFSLNCTDIKNPNDESSGFNTLDEFIHDTKIRKTNSPSLTRNSATSTLSSDSIDTIQAHKNLDLASCGKVYGNGGDGKISKTGTFLITFNPLNKKYYTLLARKTKQGEIHKHKPHVEPYFGSIIVEADRWGKWVTMGGGADDSCYGKSSLCAAYKEIQDEANADEDVLKKMVFLDCAILGTKPETAIFVAYVDWKDAQKLTEGKDVKTFIGLQTEKTKDLGKGTNYCLQYKCENMHLFSEDNITLSRKDLIDSSHDEIGFIKWVPLNEARTHELLMSYIKNSFEKFFFPSFVQKLENSFFYNPKLKNAK